MITVIQRVSRASVAVDDDLVSEIDKGYLILLGVMDDDTEADAEVENKLYNALKGFFANELTFTIPMNRFKEMLTTMNDSALYQKAFSALKRRINNV